MSERVSSYRQIIKGSSIFGGVQVFNIIIGIIKSKIIAILLGPTGMGIAGLFTTTTSFIGGLTNFGLGTSAVRNISESNYEGNNVKTSRTIFILGRLVWITGILGLISILFLSNYLSELTFGNKNYSIGFRWLSLTLLFDQLASGQRVVLQGMRQLKYLAKANILGSFIGLVISVPLYYLYHIDGIVPALIGSSFVSLIVANFFFRKIRFEKITVNKDEIVEEGKSMLSMGFVLSISSLITVAGSYIIRTYINNNGSLADVGLYSAGFAIIASYVGMVFNAMGTDYYPRLAGVANDCKKANNLIQQQAEITLLLLGPILCIFVIYAQLAVIILYSNEFIVINEMIRWAALGTYFKGISWTIAFFFIAKGDSKLYFWNELVSNIYMIILNILGYKFGGLTGLGISYLIAYLMYLIQVYLITQKKYNFIYSQSLYFLFLKQIIFGIICFLITYVSNSIISYSLGTIVIILVTSYSLYELDKRTNLFEFLRKKKL